VGAVRQAEPRPLPEVAPSAVPDILGPGLEAIFCGINPGRFSAAARAHFANPRNDFWRLLHEAGFTPRLLDPSEQQLLPGFGCGVTNAAYRTTPGSGDLRRADFEGSAERLERLALELRPRAIAFVGKEAYRGAFGERAELGLQRRHFEDTWLYVLPSTSPANAAVSYEERLHWFRALREWLHEPRLRPAARALVLDERDRILLVRFVNPHTGNTFWATPGGAVDEGELHEQAARRELAEEAGLGGAELGPWVWTREHVFMWVDRWIRQQERFYVVRVEAAEVAPTFTPEQLASEGIHEHRWWSVEEIAASDALFAPRALAALLGMLLREGPPAEPRVVGI